MPTYQNCAVELRPEAGGALQLVPRGTLRPYPERVTDWLRARAAQHPERTFVAQRDASGAWRRLSYGQALERVRALGAGLLARPLADARPVVILSGNSIEHLLLAFAAMYVGIPHVPLSPFYSRANGELDRLRELLRLLTPGLIAAFGPGPFARAIDALAPDDCEVVADAPLGCARGVTSFDALADAAGAARADAAQAAVGPDTIAKFLLTSGSTAAPKAVITTHRMMCANQSMLLQALPFLADAPPILVDWLPWSHVFGGSHNLNLVLAHGGTLYIDAGRPDPQGILATVQNLREQLPSVYFNVPRGFELLVPHLQQDATLARSFFGSVRALFCAGAGMSQPLWDALQQLAYTSTGAPAVLLAGLGATETAPLVTFTTRHAHGPGDVGLPAAGTQVRLVPVGDKLELRVKGPCVTPGYWRAPRLTAEAFDEQGYFRTGDAVALANGENLSQGLRFDGRLAEDFKLSTGTTVSVGPLRASLLLALAPLVQDVVLAGLNRNDVGLLVFPDARGCATVLAGLAASATLPELAACQPLRAEIALRLRRHALAAGGSASRVARALLLATPPSLAGGELGGKGTINQRAALACRASEITELYAAPPAAHVILVATE